MSSNEYKILVVGAGSIGMRHLKNLQALGVKQFGIVDPKYRGRTPVKLAGDGPLLVFSDLKEALKQKWDAVFICTPSSTHIGIALRVARQGIPMFIEKPVSHTLTGLSQLQKLAQNIKPVMVGYNIDFHPQFQKIKEILAKKTLGKIWGVRAEFGYYLQDWRAGQDYTKTYSVQKKLGGGIVLDDIHEINLLYHLFGPVKKAFGLTSKQSNLKIDVEDYAEIILQFQNGIIGQIHMDYLQRDYSRHLKIIGEKGTLIWYLKKAQIDLYSSEAKKWKTINKITRFDWNETYLQETKEFLRCLAKKQNPASDLWRGIKTLRIASVIKQSSLIGKCLKIKK